MTENKRFTYLNYSKNGYIGSFYLNDKPLTNKEVWDLLNKLENENMRMENRLEHLKHESKIWKEAYDTLCDMIIECPNEKLKDIKISLIAVNKVKMNGG